MSVETKEIKFYNDTLLGVKDENGQVWLAVKKACLDIGLSEGQADRQVKNLQSDLIFNTFVAGLNVKFDGQIRKVICISERFVTLWLAKISLTPAMQKKNPEAVQKLLTYQLEAADVLHKAFYETDEQKSAFHERLDLEGKIEDMQKHLEGQTVILNNMESMLCEQTEKLESVMDNMTLTTRQQETIHDAGLKRVSYLLGGAHSKEYRRKGKLYLSNLWLSVKRIFNCGSSYKDLNPQDFNQALDFVNNWEYKNN